MISMISYSFKQKFLEPFPMWYPGPRGFSWFFFTKEIKSKPWSGDKSRKRRGERERKTSGYLGLESHFHTDDRVRTWPSGADWVIFFQTRKPIWLACLMVTTEGTLRIFTPHFASLYQGRKLFVCCTRNNICTGPRHVKARHISRFWHGCCSWKNIRRNFDLGTWWALSWVSLSNKRKLCSPRWVERMCSPFYQPDMESI